MNRKELIGAVIVGMALTTVVGTGAACNGGSGTGGTTGTTTTGTTSTTTTSTHATTATGTTTGTATTGTGATTTSTGGGNTLTVKNYLSWCSVSVNGGAAKLDPVQTVTGASGSIALTASAAPGFMLSSTMWHHTAGDTGAGEAGTVANGTSSTSVMVTGNKCVWVCCPGAAQPCPTTDQCP